jgi:hypothetical protein
MTRLYQHGINEQPHIDPSAPKGHTDAFNYSCNMYVSGESVIVLHNNERNLFEAKV